mgnify:CR=1 FL=1
MEKGNSIKRATSAESQEENKRKIKAFRSEIYDRLDKGRKNAFTNHEKSDSQNKPNKGMGNERPQTR